jgi:hypothetical protein
MLGIGGIVVGIIFPDSSIGSDTTVSGQPFLVASKLYDGHRAGAYVLGALDPSTFSYTVTSAGYMQFNSYYWRRSSDTFNPSSAFINILQDGVYFAMFRGLMQGSTVQNRYVSIRRNASSSNPTEIRVYSSNGTEEYHTFTGGGFFKCYRGDTMSVYNVNAVLLGSSGYTTFMVVRV